MGRHNAAVLVKSNVSIKIVSTKIPNYTLRYIDHSSICFGCSSFDCDLFPSLKTCSLGLRDTIRLRLPVSWQKAEAGLNPWPLGWFSSVSLPRLMRLIFLISGEASLEVSISIMRECHQLYYTAGESATLLHYWGVSNSTTLRIYLQVLSHFLSFFFDLQNIYSVMDEYYNLQPSTLLGWKGRLASTKPYFLVLWNSL